MNSSKTSQSPAGEKLQKILARAGLGSRRAVEKLIEEGLVKVNGRTATLGDRASEDDKISFKGKPLKPERLEKQPTQVILYNKPEGKVCTRKDEKGRDTIYSQLPKIHNGRWVSIGRLDLNTSGLLILTNNGELANRMMHPSYEMEREYTVRIFGEVSDEIIKQVTKGVQLEDGTAKFNSVQKMQPMQHLDDGESINNWYKVIIKEGRYREVRRIWEAVGVQVSRLHRVRYGLFSLPRGLRRGSTEELTWKQVNQLLKSVGLAEEARPDLRHRSGDKPTKSTGAKPRKYVNPKLKSNQKSGKPSSGKKQLTVHDLSDGAKKKRR